MTNDLRSCTELLPWLLPVTDSIILCKDSGLLAVFEYRGLDADNADPSDVAEMAEAGERMLLQLRDMQVTVWWTLKRARSDDYPGERMPDPMSQLLDDEHRRQFHQSAAFVNRYFFTVHVLPSTGADSFFGKVGQASADGKSVPAAIWEALRASLFAGGAFKWTQQQLARGVEEFDAKLQQIGNIMAAASFRLLRGQELLGFLHAMASPGAPLVPKQWDGESFLDAYIPSQEIQVNRETLQFGDARADRQFISALSMKSWPGLLQFACFDALTTPACELVISHCYKFQSKAETAMRLGVSTRVNEFLQYPLTEWVRGVVKGQFDESKANPARRQALQDALQVEGRITANEIVFGHHNLTILIQGKTEDECELNTALVKKMLEASPFVGVIRETLHLLSGWAGTIPGQWQETRRWLTKSHENLIYEAPLLCVEMGSRYNDHLTEQLGETCQALTVVGTDKNTPFFFNFHDGALGHAAVVGPSRTGKSAAMNFLMSQFRKYPRSRLIIFDKDYSCRQPTLLQGGEYNDLRPGSSISFNPIRLVADPDSWVFLADWIEGLAGSRGYNVSADEAAQIYAAVKQTAEMESDLHRLRSVVALLPRSLQEQLKEWVGDGKNAVYFDNEEDSFSLSSFCAIEMGYVMNQPAVARAFLDYAFYRIAKMLRDQAHGTGKVGVTFIYVEECWFMLANQHFAMRLMDWLKTLAKLNAFVVLCTQSLEDLGNVPEVVWAALRDNIATYLFLPNRKASQPGLKSLYVDKFGLRPDQVERIKSATRKRDYFFVQQDVKRMLRINLTPRQLAVLRSDVASQAIFNKYYPAQQPGWQTAYINELLSSGANA